MVVNRLHPGRPGANCRVIHPGDKLVTVDAGGGPRLFVGLGLKHLKRMLEPIKTGILTLELLRANDICKVPIEILDPDWQRPYTYAVELDLDDNDSDQVSLQPEKPSTPGHVSFPPIPGFSSGSRPSTSSRPKTTSWACTDDPLDPRSTRPLNANRFERLLFCVNCKLKNKEAYALLSNAYDLDKPQTPAGVMRPRACYRLRLWWNEEEQEAVRGMLLDLVTWGHAERIKDVIGILREHVDAAQRQYPRVRQQEEAEASARREEEEAEREQRRAAGLPLSPSPDPPSSLPPPQQSQPEVVSFEEDDEPSALATSGRGRGGSFAGGGGGFGGGGGSFGGDGGGSFGGEGGGGGGGKSSSPTGEECSESAGRRRGSERMSAGASSPHAQHIQNNQNNQSNQSDESSQRRPSTKGGGGGGGESRPGTGASSVSVQERGTLQYIEQLAADLSLSVVAEAVGAPPAPLEMIEQLAEDLSAAVVSNVIAEVEG